MRLFSGELFKYMNIVESDCINYFEEKLRIKEDNSLLADPEEIIIRNIDLYNLIVLEVKKCFENYYNIRIKDNNNNRRKLLNYFLLSTGLCWIITPDKVTDTDFKRTEKYLATVNEDIISELFKSNLLVAKDSDVSIGARAESIISSLSSGIKIAKTLTDKLEGISIVKLEQRVEVTKGKLIEKYLPIYATGTINIDECIIYPCNAYIGCTEKLTEILKTNIFWIKTSNEKYFTTLNRKILSIYYSDIDISLKKCGYRFGKLQIIDFGASKYTNLTRGIQLEYLDEVRKVDKQEYNIAKNTNTGRDKLCLLYVNTDTRGALKELYSLKNYDELNSLLKFKLSGFSETEAYRYLLTIGQINSFKSYSDRFGSSMSKVDKPEYIQEYRQLLRTGVFEIKYLAKTGLITYTVTNNTNILSEIYGSDYRVKYIGYDYCLREACFKIRSLLRDESTALYFIDSIMSKEYGVINPLLGSKYTALDVFQALYQLIDINKETNSNLLVTYSVNSDNNSITRYLKLDKIIEIRKYNK